MVRVGDNRVEEVIYMTNDHAAEPKRCNWAVQLFDGRSSSLQQLHLVSATETTALGRQSTFSNILGPLV